MEEVIEQAPRSGRIEGRQAMQTPEDVQAMLKLASLGWGSKRIAAEMGCSRNTVRGYLRQGGWQPYRSPKRRSRLQGLEAWLAERFAQHRGNADVVRQDLQREHGIVIGLRSVERAVEHLRRELLAETLATVRFETPPGHQLQIDFGERTRAGRRRDDQDPSVRGHARLLAPHLRDAVPARAPVGLAHGLEGAFRHFGGMPGELLIDNAKALVSDHDAQTREVVFNDRFHAFCRYWRVVPRACAPYRARTKGKDERGVGYVKRNAIAGHRFESLEALRAHLAYWMREVADVRVHGTTGEVPLQRFERDEAAALRPLEAKAAFLQVRELSRRVHSDACVEIDTNRYSVPWRLIGESVTVVVADGLVRVLYAGEEVACHAQSAARRATVIERHHLAGVVGAQLLGVSWSTRRPPQVPPPALPADLLRPLAEYESALGGSW